jgi:hypothetical protein
MATIHETITTVQFDQTLRVMADRARTRYAGEAQRIDRALVIALNGGVTLHQDGTASVQSSSDAEVVYHVAHGTCDCPDFERAPAGRCKHRYSVCLVKKAQVQVASSAGRATYYATYTTPDGLVLQGTAQWVEDDAGWLFIDEADHAYLTSRTHALVLGGNVAILEAQRVADETAPGHVARICGYAN